MIGFNGQYLAAAAIGDMRITAMSQGDKWLLGSHDWLVAATKAAILSAFGAEGAGVIQATNAYLNGLATTDMEKAQALAGFINEDPMLVCSIVETSKTRWLVGDGKAYINTGCSYKAEDIVARFKNVGANSNCWLFGVIEKVEGIEQGFGFNYWGCSVGKPYTNYGDVGGFYRTANANKPSILYLTREKVSFVYDGVTIKEWQCTSLTNDFETSIPFYILSMNQPNVGRLAGFMAIQNVEMSKSGIMSHLFLPFIRNNVNGMLDLTSGTFHPNANTEGAFTIAITDKA